MRKPEVSGDGVRERDSSLHYFILLNSWSMLCIL